MSPVAPMPHAAWVGTNGLNAWVIVLSGELSIVSVGEELELDELGEVLDEHAATPAARTATALTATSVLGPRNLLIISVPVVAKVGYPRDVCAGELRPHVPPPCGSAITPGAATSRCQHAAARTSETRRRAGSSARQRSPANGHLGLNGQPAAAGPGLSGRRRLPSAPSRSALPRLSGSGAEATSSWV